MSDTLREQLKDADMMLDIAGYLLTSPVRKAIKDAITELDRLEAEVKKPIPDGLVKVLRYLNGEDSLDGFTYGDGAPPNQGKFWWRRYLRPFLPAPDVVPQPTWTVSHHEDGYLISGPMGSVIIKRTGVQDNDVICGLLGSLATTEPVQAAGDTAGNESMDADLKIAASIGDTDLCEGCPPIGYPTNKTRCAPCPRRAALGAAGSRPVLVAPASPSDQGQGSGTPTKQEAAEIRPGTTHPDLPKLQVKIADAIAAAEKPKPVSLVEWFDTVYGTDRLAHLANKATKEDLRNALAAIDRTLDQERGV